MKKKIKIKRTRQSVLKRINALESQVCIMKDANEYLRSSLDRLIDDLRVYKEMTMFHRHNSDGRMMLP